MITAGRQGADLFDSGLRIAIIALELAIGRGFSNVQTWRGMSWRCAERTFERCKRMMNHESHDQGPNNT